MPACGCIASYMEKTLLETVCYIMYITPLLCVTGQAIDSLCVCLAFPVAWSLWRVAILNLGYSSTYQWSVQYIDSMQYL